MYKPMCVYRYYHIHYMGLRGHLGYLWAFTKKKEQVLCKINVLISI